MSVDYKALNEAEESEIKPCKYKVGQVLGKVEVVVRGMEWEPDEEYWEINIDTDTTTSVESRYCSEGLIDDIVAEIDPVKKLERLKLEAAELDQKIKTLEQELSQ